MTCQITLGWYLEKLGWNFRSIWHRNYPIIFLNYFFFFLKHILPFFQRSLCLENITCCFLPMVVPLLESHHNNHLAKCPFLYYSHWDTNLLTITALQISPDPQTPSEGSFSLFINQFRDEGIHLNNPSSQSFPSQSHALPLFHPILYSQVWPERLALAVSISPSLPELSRALRSLCSFALFQLFLYLPQSHLLQQFLDALDVRHLTETVVLICLSRRTALLMAQDSDWWHCSQKTRPRGQSVACLQKLFFFQKKKFILCQFLRQGSGWYFLVTKKWIISSLTVKTCIY